MISNQNLYQKKYSIAELTANIAHLDVKVILYTQILTEKFCAEYILDTRMDSGDEDSYLLLEGYILRRQPHLDKKLFLELCKKQYEDDDED